MIPKEKAKPDRESEGGRKRGERQRRLWPPRTEVSQRKKRALANKKDSKVSPSSLSGEGPLERGPKNFANANPRTRTASGMTRGDPNKQGGFFPLPLSWIPERKTRPHPTPS